MFIQNNDQFLKLRANVIYIAPGADFFSLELRANFVSLEPQRMLFAESHEIYIALLTYTYTTSAAQLNLSCDVIKAHVTHTKE